MPNIGDLVVNLMMDASQYRSENELSRASNTALGGSIDAIQGKLERQRRELQSRGKTTQDNILGAAAKGASEGQINAVLQLNDEVEALRAKKAAEDAATVAMNQGRHAGESLVTQLQRQKSEHGLTAAQVRIHAAAQAGASREHIEAANALATQERAQRKLDQQVASAVQNTREVTRLNGRASNSNQILIETTRGLEDAVAGYTNNGLKGMIGATGNNLNQIGALVGGTAGLILSFGSVAAMIGVTAIPMLYKWATATENLEEKEKALQKAQEDRHNEQMKRMKTEDDYIQNRRKEIRDQKRFIEGDTARPGGQGAASADELRSQEIALREKQIAAEGRVAQASREVGESRRERQRLLAENIADSAQGIDSGNKSKIDNRDERIKRLQEAEIKALQEIRRAQRDYDDADADLKKTRTEREKKDAIQAIRDKKEAERALDQANAEAKAEFEAAQDAERKKQLQSEIADQKSFAQSIMQNIGQASPGLAAERELERKRAEIETARASGLINDKEAGTLNTLVAMKPEQAAGNAAAIQAGSKEAYSAIIRGMKQAETAKAMADQKKIAEDSKGILERIEKNTAEKETKILVDF